MRPDSGQGTDRYGSELPESEGEMAKTLDLYIAGEWTPGTGDTHHRLMSPVTGEHIADVPLAAAADIDRAVAAARSAQDEYRHWSVFERAAVFIPIAAPVNAMVPRSEE